MGSEQDGPFGALINALPDTLPPEVEELVKRLTIRARACESMALDFRDIGGRSADWLMREAAPDLYEALKALVAIDDGDNSTLWPHEALFDAARAALSKVSQQTDTPQAAFTGDK